MANSDFKLLPRLFGLFRGEKKEVAVVLVYAIGVGVFSLAVPIAVQALVNSVSFGNLLQPVVILTILLLLCLLFSGLMQVLQFYVVEILQRRIFARVAIDLAERIPYFNFFDRKSGRAFSPTLLNRFLEVVTVQKTVTQLLVDGIGVFFQTSLGLILLAFYHPILLAFAVMLLFSTIVIFFSFSRRAIHTAIDESSAKYATLGWLENLADHPVLFKSKEGLIFGIDRADLVTKEYLVARSKHFKILLGQRISALTVQAIASAVLLGIGGYLVIQHQLTLGQLVAAELIVTMVLNGVTKFTKHFEALYDLAAGVSKLDSLIQQPIESRQGEFFGIDGNPVSVTLKKVTILRLSGEPIFAQVNLSVPAGKKVAILGANGSGKTALVNAIYRLERTYQGEIEVNGHNIEDIHPEELRRQISLTRGLEIFQGTLEDNLKLGRPGVQAKDIRQVLAKLNLADKVATLPDNLRTFLDGNKDPFSKGEAYRLMIARALLSDCRLMIIDDTLDFLDRAAQELVIPVLLQRDVPWTLIVTTCDEQVARRFDAIYSIEGAKLEQLK